MKKICFVAMGFGKKMDYQNSIEVDLDIIYKGVIKPLFENEFSEYKIIRADEIAGSSVIDVAMYALLLNADLVIADITTLNPNAIYELGVRHAVRPYATIIMAQESCKIPFDLNHSRFLTYKDIGEKLDAQEAQSIMESLKLFVRASDQMSIDSPLYTFIPTVIPPKLCEEEFSKLVRVAEEKTDNIATLIKNAEDLMRCEKYDDALIKWKNLRKLLPSNDYVVQQMALATYKSDSQVELVRLFDAAKILDELNPLKSLDFETLGIAGAINKRIYRCSKDYAFLDRAIEFYQKGFIIKSDYYNGENYANCLMLKSRNPELSSEERNALEFIYRDVYSKVINLINLSLQENEENPWMFATLAVCHLALNNDEEFTKNHKIFYDKCSSNAYRNSLEETIIEIRSITNNLS